MSQNFILIKWKPYASRIVNALVSYVKMRLLSSTGSLRYALEFSILIERTTSEHRLDRVCTLESAVLSNYIVVVMRNIEQLIVPEISGLFFAVENSKRFVQFIIIKRVYICVCMRTCVCVWIRITSFWHFILSTSLFYFCYKD